jgi:hypothetical protein
MKKASPGIRESDSRDIESQRDENADAMEPGKTSNRT